MKKLLKKTTALPVVLIIVCLHLMVADPARGLTVSEEEKMGREFLRYARMAYDFVDDPFIDHYINELGHRLVKAFPDQPFDGSFYIIKNEVYNAFAAPAGHIFVYSGLINAMDNEEELAGILTHEIAHVYCRHIAKKIESSKKISLATLAGIAAGIFLGSPAVAVGSVATGQAVNLAYSREDERQADQLGVNYLCRAGYSVQGLLSVLKKINAKNWFTVYDIPSYLSTHPGTEERIAYLDTLLATHNFDFCRENRLQDNTVFTMVKTKLTALYGNTETAGKRFRAELARDESNYLAHYGYGLVLSRQARPAEAIEHFGKALEITGRGHAEIQKALANAFLLQGDFEQALETLQAMPATSYYDYEKKLLLARAFEETGRLSDSLAVLQGLLERRPDNSDAHYAIGNIYGKKGEERLAHYHLGLHYQAVGAPETTLFHLGRALSLTEDPQKKEELEEMIQQVRQDKRRR